MRSGDELSLDPEGSELPTLAAAEALAYEVIFFMASDHLRLRRKMDMQGIDITDEAGTLLASVTIQDAMRREG
jgi:hypothetical protein